MDISKYKNTVVKLIVLSNNAEIYTWLDDYDEKTGLLKLHKPIISINKMHIDPAKIIKDTLQYKNTNDNENSVSMPLTSIYSNDNNKHIAYIHSSQVIIVPIYSKEAEDTDTISTELKPVKKIFSDYIDFVYTQYSDIIESSLPDFNNINNIEEENVNDSTN